MSACPPLETKDNIQPDFNSLVDEIQIRQQEQVVVSGYHIRCTAKLLKLKTDVVRQAFVQLGVPLWPNDSDDDLPEIPDSQSELLSILLQASPYISPVFHSTHPAWSKWLNRVSFHKNAMASGSDPSVTALVDALSKLFMAADSCIDLCHSELVANGFPLPNQHHLLHAARKVSDGIPHILLKGALDIKFPNISKFVEDSVQPIQVLTKSKVSDETLGFWGFHDSAFVLKVDKYGRPFVTMEGKRYGFEGKKISKLIPFIETELESKMDPLNEAFRNVGPRKCFASQLSSHDIEALKSIVAVVSAADDERVRHGTGHCQEDVFAVRECKPIRVPDVVVWPSSEQEVEALIKLGKEKNWCLFPFGGGTNVSQATRCPPLEVEPRAIISVDMRKMCKILSIDEENGLAHIEAGITGRFLEEQLRDQGYTMGHEPDSIEFSTLGTYK